MTEGSIVGGVGVATVSRCCLDAVGGRGDIDGMSSSSDLLESRGGYGDPVSGYHGLPSVGGTLVRPCETL